MPITDNQLKAYINQFQADADESWQSSRLNKKRELSELFDEEELDDFGEGNVRELVRNLWAFQSWTNKDYIVEQVMDAGEDRVRQHISAAVADSPDHGSAFDELLAIPQFGPATASEILSFLHPTDCAIINRPTREGLEILSYESETPTRITDGDDYVEYLDVMQDVHSSVQDNMDVTAPTVALDDFIDLDYFLWWLAEEHTEEDTTGEIEEPDEWAHDEIRDILGTIGDGLGFQVRTEYGAATRAQIDTVWKTQIANLGTIGYAFEVQHSGSEDSAILNLQKAINLDPEIQQGVLVSTEEQLDSLRREVESLGDFASAVSYLSVKNVLRAERLQGELREILREANLAT